MAHNNSTVTSCRQFHSQSDTAADALCMETSFGMESDEPRTHIFHSSKTHDQFNTQLPISGFYCTFFARCGRHL